MVRVIPAESIPVEIMKTIPVADVAATLYPIRQFCIRAMLPTNPGQ